MVRTWRDTRLEDEEEAMVRQEDTNERVIKQGGTDMVVKTENDNADDRDLDLPCIDDIINGWSSLGLSGLDRAEFRRR